ncbi:MAG TPA: isochorismatase family cysteine hydrolase [Acidobacteriaceae bacterium]|nr:isochorismatase family cysteine hydrolase [Acidobacteriaceae bacterium]
MPLQPSLNPARTAILSMDLQAAIVRIYTADQEQPLMTRVAEVLQRCRECGATVIHIQVGFRPGVPEINPRNALFEAIRNSPERQKLFQSDAGKIHPSVAPAGDDIVITKHRISAFTGTDLEMILRSKDLDTLVLFGIATSGVVLSTLLDAVDADYRVIVIGDCCADQDADVHRVLIEKFFPRRGTVVSAAELLENLAG